MAWVVENFQVPVPIGDCSFHFLFRESQGLFTKATLQYAFIMDGGKNSAKRKADDAIKSTLGLARNILSTKYGIAANKIVFNAWVVTHWDSDHYVGVNSLLNSGNNVWFKETFSDNPKLYCGRCTGFDKKLVEMMDNRFAVIGGEELIGLDLLSGERITDIHGTPNPNVAPEKGRPRFLVVGANGYGIAFINKTVKNKAYNNRVQARPTRNETSILSVLYWPDLNGKCSYFTGGDGNPKVEMKAVLPYLRKGLKMGPRLNKGESIDLMKLDHHGSSGEGLYVATLPEGKRKPNALDDIPLSHFRPANILVTPGSEFGHPTFDVVHFILDLFLKTNGVDGTSTKTTGRVFSTRSPYWITKATPTVKDINAAHQRYLYEIHEVALKAWANKKQKESTLSMLVAEGASSSVINSRRRGELKKWYRRVIAQLALANAAAVNNEVKTVTDYRVNQLIEKYEAELRQSVIDAIEKDDGDLEIETSRFDDVDQTVLDNMHNVQFAGREMWKVICDQGIVDPAPGIDPFFVVRFTFRDGKLEPIEYMDRDGKKKQGNLFNEPVRTSARLAQRKKDLEQGKVLPDHQYPDGMSPLEVETDESDQDDVEYKNDTDEDEVLLSDDDDTSYLTQQPLNNTNPSTKTSTMGLNVTKPILNTTAPMSKAKFEDMAQRSANHAPVQDPEADMPKIDYLIDQLNEVDIMWHDLFKVKGPKGGRPKMVDKLPIENNSRGNKLEERARDLAKTVPEWMLFNREGSVTSVTLFSEKKLDFAELLFRAIRYVEPVKEMGGKKNKKQEKTNSAVTNDKRALESDEEEEYSEEEEVRCDPKQKIVDEDNAKNKQPGLVKNVKVETPAPGKKK